jgi:hyperosmotically inducible protein
MLVGLASKNAILIVKFAEQLCERGMTSDAPKFLLNPKKKKQLLALLWRLENCTSRAPPKRCSRSICEVITMKKSQSPAVLAVLLILSITLLAAPTPQGQPTGALPQKSIDRISKEVHHELVMLPFYGVFDSLAYKVDPDGTVTLLGQVARPTLKSDAENVVKRIEGVEKVVNNIEVLPTSINDDRIRRATYRAIYGNSVLSQYQLRAVPPIHIIVKNGHVTLEGTVARQMDKQVAGVRANGVHGVFSVTNNLQVEEQEKK